MCVCVCKYMCACICSVLIRNRTHYEVLVIQFLLPELRKRRVVWYGAISVSALLGLTVARLRRRKYIPKSAN